MYVDEVVNNVWFSNSRIIYSEGFKDFSLLSIDLILATEHANATVDTSAYTVSCGFLVWPMDGNILTSPAMCSMRIWSRTL